ncbi:MAG: hypothetical protein K9K67_16230 [Bacteriovoracaceae bacterium]|nr:hypothetical protein [Bacteriovoracaceae bacterium]
MNAEIATFKNEVSHIFNPIHSANIKDTLITDLNIQVHQKDFIQIYLQEQKLDALKVFSVINNPEMNLEDLLKSLTSVTFRQDYLINDGLKDYSAFLDTTDSSGTSFSINFAGFSLYEKKMIGTNNETEWFSRKEFSIFRLKFYTNPGNGKLYAQLKLKNRRRTRNQINFFREEVDFVRDWIKEHLPNLRLSLVDVRAFFYEHSFNQTQFEHLGYYVSDILDDFDENLPVELKFKPTKKHLKPKEIYYEIDKHVQAPLTSEILSSLSNVLDPKNLNAVESSLANMQYSKFFFESAYKAFEKGVGHLRKIDKVDDKDIAFRFDFPQNESGVIKVDNQNGGKYLRYIDNELNKYLSKI